MLIRQFLRCKKTTFQTPLLNKNGDSKQSRRNDLLLGNDCFTVLDRVTSTYAYDFTGEVTHSDRKDLCEFSE